MNAQITVKNKSRETIDVRWALALDLSVMNVLVYLIRTLYCVMTDIWLTKCIDECPICFGSWANRGDRSFSEYHSVTGRKRWGLFSWILLSSCTVFYDLWDQKSAFRAQAPESRRSAVQEIQHTVLRVVIHHSSTAMSSESSWTSLVLLSWSSTGRPDNSFPDSN